MVSEEKIYPHSHLLRSPGIFAAFLVSLLT